MRLCTALIAVVLLAACRDEPPPRANTSTLGVAPVYRGLDCGRGSPSAAVTWIGERAALEQVMNRMRRASFGAEPVPAVDFSRHGLVLIEIGQRPTAGFQVSLATRLMVRDKGDGVITFSVDRPIGDYAAQVVTSPCLLVAVPRGDYAAIRAQSSDNAIRVSTPVR